MADKVTAKKDDVLVYAPWVRVHAMCRDWSKGGNGIAEESWKTYDLSDDIVSCSVTLNINKESSFDVTLANPDGKYSDFFHDLDRVTITCGKDDEEGVRLFTGMVFASDSFRLYGENVRITGMCPIHLLRLHYWNPNSVAAGDLLAPAEVDSTASTDMSLADSILKALLVDVVGWPEDMIEISDLPDGIVEAAADLYEKNKDIISTQTSIAGSQLDGSTTMATQSDVGGSGETTQTFQEQGDGKDTDPNSKSGKGSKKES